MDEDAERGVIFTLGLLLGLAVMWLVFTTRGRQTAQQVFEVAGDLAEQAGELVEQAAETATEVAGDLRERLA